MNVKGLRCALVAVALTLGLGDRANAQQPEIPRPQLGKTLDLQQQQIRIQPTKDGPIRVVADVPITVTVLEADSQKTVVRWKRGVMKMTDIDCDLVRTNPQMKPLLLQRLIQQAGPLMSTMDNVSFDVIVGREWEYQGLANFDEVLAAVTKSLDAVDDLRRQNGGTPIEKAFRDHVLNRKVIEQIAPVEVMTYLAGNKYSLRRGTTARFAGAVPNPLGGDPVTSEVKVTFDQAKDGNGCSVLRTSSTMDANAWVTSLKQMIASTPGGKPLSPEDEAAMRNMELESMA